MAEVLEDIQSGGTMVSEDVLDLNFRVINYEERLKQLELNVKLLTEKQLKAYNIAAEYLNGNNGKQMFMFVTGEGGTGKSFLISLIMEFTHLYYGKQKGLYGSALAIAPTGAATNLINGPYEFNVRQDFKTVR
jgi:hypothetical protein